MMKKAVPVLAIMAFLLNSCFLDTWFGVETVEPEALYTITMGPPPTGTATITPTPDPDITPSPVPTRGIGSSQVSPVDGMTMIYIPAEPFLMGGGVESDEVPVHTVSLDAYWMDQTEVTCDQFQQFVAETGYRKSEASLGYAKLQCEGGSDRPVRATWDAARAYCQWAGRRLPTEAEWEKAARGGLEGMVYPWGDQQPVCEKGAENGAMFYDGVNCLASGPVPVKSYQPNGYGLFDMAGNASEWVFDWYGEDYYDKGNEGAPFVNPRGPGNGVLRVKRGGSYSTDASSLRVTSREGASPNNMLGFRCAADSQ